MLQQTTVSAVIPYYQRWVRELPTVRDAADASLSKILKLWQGLGYYQRAKNIHKAARLICDEYHGRLPTDPLRLKTLPGFGPYTTGAVLSVAFDFPCPIIDANVRRVVMRLLAIKGYADTRQDQRILRFLNGVLPSKDAGIFNQALMELGALLCRNRSPSCLSCPVKGDCRAYRKGVQQIIPQPKKRVIQKADVAVGILKRGEKYFIQKRPSKGLLADLWEFPCGKIDENEAPVQALKREFREELGIAIDSVKPLMYVRHSYTQFCVRLHVFFCQALSYPSQDKTHRWVDLPGLSEYPMPSGSARIVEKLQHPA
jgi:A/G-specific adenine glycosylase